MLAALPQPPADAAMAEGAQALFTLFLLLPLSVMLIVAIRRLVRDRDPIMLLCIAGGSLAMFFEPVVDVMGLCFFPRENQWVIFEVFGRPIPLFIAFVYPWYVGGQGYIAYRLFSRGIDMRGVFRLWVLFSLCNMALESPGILADVYLYYGEQPLNPWGLPLWWAFVNPVMPLLVGALIFRLRPQLGTGWKLLLILPMVPMADGAANGATAWPIWLTLNTDLGKVATNLGALATLGLVLTAVWLIAQLVATDSTAATATAVEPVEASGQLTGVS